jgi:TonB family protein
MKTLLFAFVFLIPSLLATQAPSIYDEWTGSFMGAELIYKISPQTIIFLIREPSSPNGMPRPDKPDTMKTLEVVFDSLTSAGRIFTHEIRDTARINVLRFRIRNNSAIELEVVINEIDTPFYFHRTRFNDLESAKRGTVHSLHAGYTFRLFSSRRTAELRKLKAPTLMKVTEVIKLIDSLGRRLRESIRKQPTPYHFDVQTIFEGSGQELLYDLVAKFGYNPLKLNDMFEKYKNDEDISDAFNQLREYMAKAVCLGAADSNGRKWLHPKLHKKPVAKIKPPPKLRHKTNSTANDIPSVPIYPPAENTYPLPKEVPPEIDELNVINRDAFPLTSIQSLIVYPEFAKRAGIEGKVWFSALVETDGSVKQVKIEKSDNKLFDQAVIDAVMKTKFSPATQGKVRVVTWYTNTISFSLAH